MRQSNQKRRFSRTRSQKRALMRGLAISLIKNDKIITTEAKARELRPFVEKLITTSKKDTVPARRKIMTALGEPSKSIATKLFTIIAPHYSDRPGGYTRIIKMGRTSPGKDEAVIELV